MRWTPAHTATATVMLEWIALIILVMPCLLAYAGLLFFFRICDWVSKTWQRRAKITKKEKAMRNLLLVCLALVFICGCRTKEEANKNYFEAIKNLQSYETKETSVTIVFIGETLKATGLTRVTFSINNAEGEPLFYGNALTFEEVVVGQKMLLVSVQHRKNEMALDYYHFVVSSEE